LEESRGSVAASDHTGDPEDCAREEFVADVIGAYTRGHPLDAVGKTHVTMVRLEVEAYALPG